MNAHVALMKLRQVSCKHALAPATHICCDALRHKLLGICALLCILVAARYVGDDSLIMAGAPIRNVVYIVAIREAGIQAAVDGGAVTSAGRISNGCFLHCSVTCATEGTACLPSKKSWLLVLFFIRQLSQA